MRFVSTGYPLAEEGTSFRPIGITNRGDVWGHICNFPRPSHPAVFMGVDGSAVCWAGSSGGVTNLEPIGDDHFPYVTSMNDAGMVAGLVMPLCEDDPDFLSGEAPARAFVWSHDHGYRVFEAGDARFAEAYINNAGVVGATLLYSYSDYDFDNHEGPFTHPVTGTTWGSAHKIPSARLFTPEDGTWRESEAVVPYDVAEMLYAGSSPAVNLEDHDIYARPRGFLSVIRPPDSSGRFLTNIFEREGFARPGYLDGDGVLALVDIPMTTAGMDFAQALFLCSDTTVIGRDVSQLATVNRLDGTLAYLHPLGESGVFEGNREARSFRHRTLQASPSGLFVVASGIRYDAKEPGESSSNALLMWPREHHGQFGVPRVAITAPHPILSPRAVNDRGQVLVDVLDFSPHTAEFVPKEDVFAIFEAADFV